MYLRLSYRPEVVCPEPSWKALAKTWGQNQNLLQNNHTDIWSTSFCSPMRKQGPTELEAGLPKAPSSTFQLT